MELSVLLPIWPSFLNRLNAKKGHALFKNRVQSAADEGKILLTTFDQFSRRGKIHFTCKWGKKSRSHKLVFLVLGKMSAQDNPLLQRGFTDALKEFSWAYGRIYYKLMSGLCFVFPPYNLWPTHARLTHFLLCPLGKQPPTKQFPHVYRTSVCQPFWKTFPFRPQQ